MSLSDVFDELGLDILPDVIDQVSNGEFRVVTTTQATSNATDDFGFLSPETENKTHKFIPCVWKVSSGSGQDGDERTVAGQTRGLVRYKLTVPRKWKGYPVEVSTHDSIELRQSPGHNQSVLKLQVLSAINVSNVVTEIRAIDINAS